MAKCKLRVYQQGGGFTMHEGLFRVVKGFPYTIAGSKEKGIRVKSF